MRMEHLQYLIEIGRRRSISAAAYSISRSFHAFPPGKKIKNFLEVQEQVLQNLKRYGILCPKRSRTL